MTATPSTPINTSRIPNRRKLHFNSLDEILADVDALAQAPSIQPLGNWSPGQILNHLSKTMNYSIDGFPAQMPAIIRFFMRLFMKNRLLNKPMSPGFKLPKSASYMLPLPTVLNEGLAQFRAAIQRQKTETRRVPSPFLGPFTNEDWTRLHCRHAELHLGFLIPANSSQ